MAALRPAAAGSPPRAVPRRLLLRFVAAGLAALLLLALAAGFALRRVATREAVNDAAELSSIAARSVASLVSDGLADGEPAEVARFDAAVRERVLGAPIVRVKLWDETGTVVYSDDSRLVGDRFGFDGEELEVLREGGVEAEVGDLDKPENRFEPKDRPLLEVYQQVQTPSGRPLLLETYQEFSSVAAEATTTFREVLPGLLLAMVLLEALQLPLAWTLVKRLQAGQRERELLLQRALDASDDERRRIARDLHDGVVQTLVSVSYGLSAVQARAYADPAVGPAVATAATVTRQGIQELRSLLVDIYPPSLAASGLGAALSDLSAPLAGQGVEVRLDVPADLDLAWEVESLLYRVAREALRNVSAHAHASSVDVTVRRVAGRVIVTLADDGVGLPGGHVAAEGHFGVRTMKDLAVGANGSFAVSGRDGGGRVVEVEVPAA
ncbi:sensor histidine kinase [Motilibacter aurantiacus]|uniref:sensor histidine kinase n=1 Tax=Motilibacter aurantiacus TaxID=2714955 RepID=UPI001407B0C2|nr:histidine kinase [Motilibacter aurantiacus]NHC44544.1 integral membrane sensor signal transduction histidine kinase [Motilibacter aurantiacus]